MTKADHASSPRHHVTKAQKCGPIRSLLAAAHTFRGRVSIAMAAVAAAIADPKGYLPAAASEGALVARALGPGTLVAGSGTGVVATRAQLWRARNARLLHVAADVIALGRWRALPLADGEVSPVEMVQHRLAPRIAVLSNSCSAAAMDEEGWGSLAAALLESGIQTS